MTKRLTARGDGCILHLSLVRTSHLRTSQAIGVIGCFVESRLSGVIPNLQVAPVENASGSQPTAGIFAFKQKAGRTVIRPYSPKR